jgi:uncharacterized membrane protein (DUF373 family)
VRTAANLSTACGDDGTESGTQMASDDHAGDDAASIAAFANRTFQKIEVFAYLVLGLMIALTALLGTGRAAMSLWTAVAEHGDKHTVVATIDRLLFVLMVVEILHTVRVSFRTGALTCEPFLIVGLIASIRRILVITLESSQAAPPGTWTPDSQGLFNATMLELGVLGGLILVMVISIYVLRRSERRSVRTSQAMAVAPRRAVDQEMVSADGIR